MNPPGDLSRYVYGVVDFTAADGLTHIIGPSNAGQGWLVHRIQAFAGPATNMTVTIQGQPIGVTAGAALCLEPWGSHRTTVAMSGNTGRIIIEYWAPAVATGIGTPIVIT